MSSMSIAQKILVRYFHGIPVPASFEAIRNAPESIVVVTQSKSRIFRALLDSFAQRSGLEGARYETDTLVSSRSEQRFLRWVSIHDEPALESLARTQPELAFSTLNVFPARGPMRNNPGYHVGFRKLAAVLLLARFLIIIFGSPIRLDGASQRKMKVSRLLRLDFYRNLKLVRGTPFQPIEAQARSILGGAEYDRELSVVALRNREAKDRVRRRARHAFFEMAANPRSFMYWLLAPVAAFIVRRLFSTVTLSGLEDFAATVKEHTVVVVPMHRSHLDYIILGATLYHSGINPPVVAAGVNLSFWPAGFFIRSLGGYFVKRNARHDRVHALLLRRYVTYLVKHGHLQEFFIEGGRSRSGKMRPPKVGILSIIVDAYLKGLRKDILFVPVSLSYENVIEANVYGDENTGRSKEKENVFALLRAGSIFKQKYGQVSVNFGKALSLEKFAGAFDKRCTTNEEKTLVLELASVLTRKIRDQTEVSLSSLAYMSLMMAPRYALRRRDLARCITELADLARKLQNIDPNVGRLTTTLQDFLNGEEALLGDLLRGGIISTGSVLGEEVFVVPGAKRFTADFYRNATIHVFFFSSLFAILELLDRPISADSCQPFHPMFDLEFLLPHPDAFGESARKNISALLDAGVLTGSDSPRFRERSIGTFTPGLLLSTIQAQLWVVLNLRQVGALSEATNQVPAPIDFANFLKQLQGDFKTAAYSGIVTRTEASSHAALTGALDAFQQRRLISITENGGKQKQISILKDLSSEEATLREVNDAILRWQYLSA